MRRVDRTTLSKRSQTYLTGRTKRVRLERTNGTLDVNKLWRMSRQTKALKEAFATLVYMAGDRKRCMYCGDSEGSDIEHFKPKSRFPMQMYSWNNMLLCCSTCGSLKLSQFPTANGSPLLIDPSIEDPWTHLDFIPATGIITARFAIDGSVSAKGVETVKVLHLDKRQSVHVGCRRTDKHLRRVVQDALDNNVPDASALIAELKQEDDQGLCGWIFSGNGKHQEPFRTLRTAYPAVWTSAVAELS